MSQIIGSNSISSLYTEEELKAIAQAQYELTPSYSENQKEELKNQKEELVPKLERKEEKELKNTLDASSLNTNSTDQTLKMIYCLACRNNVVESKYAFSERCITCYEHNLDSMNKQVIYNVDQYDQTI
jgi:hypothetical protein